MFERRWILTLEPWAQSRFIVRAGHGTRPATPTGVLKLA